MTALLLLLACAPAPQGPRIYAISYGRSERFSRRALIGDAPEGARVPAAWMAWLIRDGQTNILVDTGTSDPALLARWGIHDHRPVADGLARLRIGAEDIDELVLTHPHWDHIGDVGAFPQARVWIQREALDWARQKVADGQEHAGILPANLATLDGLGDNLNILVGDAELNPRVHLRLAGGHTPGTQWVQVDGVVVDGVAGPAALAADLACVYENLERGVAPGGSLDPAADRAAIAELLRVTGSAARIVPGHDPAVFSRLKRVEEGVFELR